MYVVYFSTTKIIIVCVTGVYTFTGLDYWTDIVLATS